MKRWLQNKVKLPQYIDNLVSNGFDDLDLVKEIQMEDLQEIGVDLLGHRRKIITEVGRLNNNNNMPSGILLKHKKNSQ